MSNNFHLYDPIQEDDRPPLPLKSILKTGPPLPPKLNKPKEEIVKEKTTKRQKKPKKSKNLFINNSSYALSNVDNNPMDKEDKFLQVKEEIKVIETPNGKKSSILSKVKKMLKKTKHGSKSPSGNDKVTNSSEISESQFSRVSFGDMNRINCSNADICQQYCSTCQAFQNIFHNLHQFHIRDHHSSYSLHDDRHLPMTSACCQWRDGQSTLSSIDGDNLSPNSHVKKSSSEIFGVRFSEFPISPIIPNRTRVKSPQPDVSPRPNVDVVNPDLLSQPVAKPSPLDNYSKFLNENLMELKRVGWYWGSVGSAEAEKVMTNRPDGTFLVRDSAHAQHLFSVTFRVNQLTHHVRIQFSQNRFWWNHNSEDGGFGSIIELIDNSMEKSSKGEYRYFENTDHPNVPPYAVSLLNPLSRFNVMSSLKHLARFVIISNVRSDHLDSLPLPQKMLSYLCDKEHHYIENFDRYVNIIDNVDVVREPD